jgi:hypothetical protein
VRAKGVGIGPSPAVASTDGQGRPRCWSRPMRDEATDLRPGSADPTGGPTRFRKGYCVQVFRDEVRLPWAAWGANPQNLV